MTAGLALGASTDLKQGSSARFFVGISIDSVFRLKLSKEILHFLIGSKSKSVRFQEAATFFKLFTKTITRSSRVL